MLTDIKFQYCNPEIWGGIECTINRIHDTYLDQLKLAGHYDRTDDIKRFAELGIKSLRFPVLWEQHEQEPDQDINWSWAEAQLHTILQNGIQPIVGLVHHGSGPSYTNLNSKSFAPGLAAYASKVAQKFPWIEYYTPVNEPLTTARFSGLYGYWYPHHSNDRSFARMLLNQIKAIVLSMREIRKINPSAKLVQTEDLSKTYSTPYLRYQADFENERRWLTNDFLCGKVDSDHPLWEYFIRIGIPESSLNFFLENPCPPDILGFNHYITSERFLDDDLNKYPPHMHGGNWVERYVDTEAVRVQHGEPWGLNELLKEAWERFGLPMALTEVHLHCSREEQLRWFYEAWKTTCTLKQQGINIKAITAWSLLGAYGWNRLLTSPGGDYESGVFDLRTATPRPTAMAKLIKSISSGSGMKHPVLHEKGWWHREMRFFFQSIPAHIHSLSKSSRSQPILIIGKRGTLGNAFAKVCEIRGLNYRLLGREDLDLCEGSMIEKAINHYKPWAIINAAGFVRVDDAETEVEKCFFDNTVGPENLARLCHLHGIKLLSFSSDLVFDGQKKTPYFESDKTEPLNIYGKSKAKKEELVLEANPDALIVRTSAFFGPWDQYNFVNAVLSTMAAGQTFIAANDVSISPTYVPDLVNTSLDLLIDDEKQVWHLSNDGDITWSDLAKEVAGRAGYSKHLLNGQPLHLMNWKAPRPVYSVLKSEKGVFMPSLDNALHRYFEEKKVWPASVAV